MTKVETLRSMKDKIIFLKIKIKVSSKFTASLALSLVKSVSSLIFSIRGHVSPDFMLALADGTLPPIFSEIILRSATGRDPSSYFTNYEGFENRLMDVYGVGRTR